MATNDAVMLALEKKGVNTRFYNSGISAYKEQIQYEDLNDEKKEVINKKLAELPINDADLCNFIKKEFEPELAEKVLIRAEHIVRSKNANDRKKDILTKYIFDKNRVHTKKNFTFLEIDGVAGYGFLLPREIDKKDSFGNIVAKVQKNCPVIITSNGNILEVDSNFEEEHKTKFGSIPTELSLRWSLNSIKDFLDGNYKEIDGRELLEKIKNKYKKYLYFHHDDWYLVHALWDIGTYFFLLFRAYPILELRGFMGTAKTKVMTVSKNVSFNPTNIMINPSESTLFRETNDKRPTKYLDEAEKLFRNEKGTLVPDQRVEVINSGYSSGGNVPRVERIDDKFVTVYYNTFSPTMIGSINGLHGATEDRAIIHITVKAPETDNRGDTEVDEPNESDECQKIRDELYFFAMQNWKLIKETYQDLQNSTKLKNRDFQIWKPLLAIAKTIDEGMYSRVKEFAEEQSEIKKADRIVEGTQEYNLLKIAYDLLQEGKEIIFIKEVHERYPSQEYKPSYKTIGNQLDKLGLRDFKQHTSQGNGYRITRIAFESIINPLFPSFCSDASYPSRVEHSEQSEQSELVTEEVIQ